MAEVPHLRFGPFQVDLANACVWRGEQALKLTPKALAVLRHLVERAGRLVTKKELFRAVWPETVVSEAALSACIRELRRVLKDDARAPRYLETVHRRGFRFVGQVVSSSPPQLSPDPRPPTPNLVGRAAELMRLREWLDKALRGERQLVFVTGEAGIGKTTLVEAFLLGVRGQGLGVGSPSHPQLQRAPMLEASIPIPNPQPPTPGVWVGWGQCIEHFSAGEPYLPLLSALGQLGREPGHEQLVAVLSQYAPTWLVQMPGILTANDLEALQRKAAGATRERMLREMAEAVEVVTALQPLVLVLEDLHWSDVSTLDLLAFLARRKEAARLLVIGTYRPVEMLNDGHPLQSVTQELYVHRLATELPLQLLSEADIAAYLDMRLRGGARHTSQHSLARLLHQRTDGNPLFLVSTVEELVDQGILNQTDHSWSLQGKIEDIGIAESIRHLVARQSGRLSLEERHTLEAASVAGMEFSAAAVAAALMTETVMVERRCEQLAERHQFLRRAGVETWPDGTLAARYSFLHAVYQQLWHERVSPTQLQYHHLQIGERKEHAYGDRAREIATELAVHFEQGRDYPRAVQYLQLAGENAVRRSANQEAISLFTREWELLQALPDTPERTRHELTLHLALGAPLLAMKGYTAPEVEVIYSRALALCRQGGEPAQRFQALAGLWQFYNTRAEFQTARELAEQLLALAQSTRDPALLLGAHDALGQTLFMLAELTRARGHLEQSLALYDPTHHHSLATLLGGEDPGVACRGYTAWTLWLLGYPAQARQRMHEALTLAQDLHSPFDVAFILSFASHLHLMRREGPAAHEQVEAMMRLIVEQGFPYWLAWGAIVRGWALAGRGQGKEGIAQLRQGLTDYRAAGVELFRPRYLTLLAEAYERVGQEEEGLRVLAEALATVNKTGERVYEAELYRLKGELTLAQSSVQSLESSVTNPQPPTPNSQAEAEEYFHQAIAIARKQQAKSLELRATTSLARLWQQQGKSKEAHQLLAEVYGWFTEGFETADLKEAKDLLEELRRR